jgi:hypothetical protein
MSASIFSDLFREGYREAERDAQEQRAMFGQRGDAVEREREFYWQQGVPARRPPADESKLRALVDLCNEQAAELAQLRARPGDFSDGAFETALAEIAELREVLGEYGAALAGRDAEINRLAALSNRFQANGRRALAENKKLSDDTAELRALYAALAALRRTSPRLSAELVKRLRAAAHPDRAKSGGAQEQAAMTKISQELAAVIERIERGQ